MKPVKRLDAELSQRAHSAIAHGALTNSKRPECFVRNVYPQHLKKGLGCKIWDTYDNQYIDFIGGLGTNVIGYAQEEISEAISKQARLGATLSLGTETEVKLSERIKEFVPFIDKIRVLKTGSEACSAAVRIARAYTGKSHIVSEGYHGWHDGFLCATPPARGVPEEYGLFTHALDLATPGIPGYSFSCAAVIVEPVLTEYNEKRIEFLKALRTVCTENKILLIFDEIITGFRVPEYTIAKATGVIPDLICLGKAIGGGMPLAIVGGSAEIMDSDYFVSSTFAGETVTMAAAIKFLDLIQTKFSLPLLWEKGAYFLEQFNKIWPEGIRMEGYPTRGVFKAKDEETKALFFQESCKAGILVGPSYFFTFPHIEVMDETLSAFRNILTFIKLGHFKLEGEMPVSPFAQKVRG